MTEIRKKEDKVSPSPYFDKLVASARASQTRAYAPYSAYHVGAAILGADGEIYSGCNVESASYGLSICAERAAIATMVDAGCQQIKEVVVVTADGGSPCGACRQVLIEFSKNESVPIWCLDRAGTLRTFTVEELLPHAFRLGDS